MRVFQYFVKPPKIHEVISFALAYGVTNNEFLLEARMGNQSFRRYLKFSENIDFCSVLEKTEYLQN